MKQSGGGDFYVPFWNDAKKHVAGISDLSEQTEFRITRNSRRGRLYPILMTGFLHWWNDKRKWSNQEFQFISESVKGKYQVSDLGATVKIENILALKIDENMNRIIYPYFCEDPKLREEGARIGLWLLNATLVKYQIEDMRILDIFRAQSYSVADFPLHGNEEEFFVAKYRRILEQREILREEYN